MEQLLKVPPNYICLICFYLLDFSPEATEKAPIYRKCETIILCNQPFSLSFSAFLSFHTKNHTHAARVITPPRLYERVVGSTSAMCGGTDSPPSRICEILFGSPNPLSEMMMKVAQTIVMNNAGTSVMIYGFLLIVK